MRFEIRDTGIGIAKDAQSKLFKEFLQISQPQHPDGTGLGLAIAAKLVEVMKGSIGIESDLGAGSTFHFSLPFEEISRAGRCPPTELVGLPALVVESNCTSREAIAAILESAGMKITTVEASDALDKLSQAAAEKHPYTIAIIAHRPNATDDLALAAAINADASLAPTRVILLCSVSEDRTRLLARGDIHACISKPVTFPRLLGGVSDALGLQKPEMQGGEQNLSSRKPVGEIAEAEARILVAEDNPIGRKLAKMQLESLGYSADVTSDGREALNAQMAHHYPIVLMDCEMPEMDGYAATRAIRQGEAGGLRATIIAMTANAIEDDREKCLAAGMDDYIAKPVTIEVLRTALSRWTDAQREKKAARAVSRRM